MNSTIESLLRHRSIRHYQDKEVSDSLLKIIIDAGRRAPNWNNFQLASVIAIKDPERRNLMSRLCGNQPYVAQAPVFLIFCADYYRVWLALEKNNEHMAKIMDDIDAVMVGVHEAAIFAATVVAAAESLGLGTVCIGDVRLYPGEMIRELQLPKYVFPVVGLCLGHAASDPGLRPRLPVDAIFFNESYNLNQIQYIEDFNRIYRDYYQQREDEHEATDWSMEIRNFYKEPFHYPDTGKMLREQGFLNDGKYPINH